MSGLCPGASNYKKVSCVQHGRSAKINHVGLGAAEAVEELGRLQAPLWHMAVGGWLW